MQEGRMENTTVVEKFLNSTIKHDHDIIEGFNEIVERNIFIAFYVVLMLLIIIGNGSITCMICMNKHLLTPTNMIIVSLCISGMLSFILSVVMILNDLKKCILLKINISKLT